MACTGCGGSKLPPLSHESAFRGRPKTSAIEQIRKNTSQKQQVKTPATVIRKSAFR